MSKLLHIIPAAGKASRIGGIPKFLLPIGSDNFLIKFHSNLLVDNNLEIQKVIVVSSDYFEAVKRLNLDAEIVKADTKTMNETTKVAINKFPDFNRYLITMPDTFFEDKNVIKNLVKKSTDNEVNISLALWKIKTFQKGKLGQVKTTKGYVQDVVDKDMSCNFDFAWGAISWKSEVNNLINSNDPHIGYIINSALKHKIKIDFIKAKKAYFDCGTFEEYSRLLRFL
jgi:hypothetical protein